MKNIMTLGFTVVILACMAGVVRAQSAGAETSAQTRAIVTIDPTSPARPYSRMIFGGFIEHFHRQIYGGVFEPGSAFKIVAIAAALDHGLITPDTLIDCENGVFNPYGHVLRDFHELGVVPVRTAGIQSAISIHVCAASYTFLFVRRQWRILLKNHSLL